MSMATAMVEVVMDAEIAMRVTATAGAMRVTATAGAMVVWETEAMEAVATAMAESKATAVVKVASTEALQAVVVTAVGFQVASARKRSEAACLAGKGVLRMPTVATSVLGAAVAMVEMTSAVGGLVAAR